MKYSLSALTLVLLLLISAATGAVLTNLTIAPSSDQKSMVIETSSTYGENVYTLIEVDDGDNDEEDVITQRLHAFELELKNADGIVIWDFNDGTTATGAMVSHSFQQPGRYLVTATSTIQDRTETTSIELTVGVIGQVESDNMECVCAPTAKDTVVNLVPTDGVVSFSGVVNVEHDGSSESCTLRNPLQECHIRVLLEHTMDGSVVSQSVLFDDTFRTNDIDIPFELANEEFMPGEGLQLRLETDQVRDWHKPNTQWTMTAPTE